MSGNNGRLYELSRSQRRAIAALMAYPTVPEAAEVAGCSERSIYRWLAEHNDFRSELSRAEAAAISDASRRLARLLGLAIETLEAVMRDSEASHSSATRAAQLALEYGARFHEVGVIETRLAELERRVLGGA